MARSILTLIGILFLSATVGAQAEVEQLQISGVQLTGDGIVAAVSVLDADGNPVPGLDPAAFAARLDSEPLEVSGVTASLDEGLPLALVVVVDTSGSMAGEPLAAARQAISGLVESLRPGDRIALMSFGNSVVTNVPLTEDTIAFSVGVEALGAAGNTALYAAASAAAATAADAPEPRRAVVLLSDGQDFGNVSGVTREDSISLVRNSGVPFFVVGLGDAVDTDYLTALAATPSSFLTASSPAELAALYDRVSDRLRAQYTLRVRLPAQSAPGPAELEISVAGAAARAPIIVPGQELPAPSITLAGLPPILSTATTITVTDIPGNVALRVTVDGLAVQSQGNAFTLDPLDLAPGIRQLRVEFEPPAGRDPLEQPFQVAAVAPVLLEPDDQYSPRPGELLRLRFRAQPGTAPLATLLVDGAEVERVDGPPYELTVPSGLAPGTHTIVVMLAVGDESDMRPLSLTVESGGGSRTLAYAIVALCALASLAAVGYGTRLVFARARERTSRLDTSRVGEKLAAWGEEHRGRPALDTPATPVPVAAKPAVWGTLTVIEGPDAGRRFDLKEDTELIGRGKACSVRLRDDSVRGAHFLLQREGVLVPSTPDAAVHVDGQSGRRLSVMPGATISLGKTTLRYEEPWSPDPAHPA